MTRRHCIRIVLTKVDIAMKKMNTLDNDYLATGNQNIVAWIIIFTPLPEGDNSSRYAALLTLSPFKSALSYTNHIIKSHILIWCMMLICAQRIVIHVFSSSKFNEHTAQSTLGLMPGTHVLTHTLYNDRPFLLSSSNMLWVSPFLHFFDTAIRLLTRSDSSLQLIHAGLTSFVQSPIIPLISPIGANCL